MNSSVQRPDPRRAEAEGIIKTCVHYGFCTNTCPTYVLLRDENDSPRGRIDLIREMLDKGGTPDPKTVSHLDRCLSCLSCMTTCAAKVDYAHLIDHARNYIEKHFKRPLVDRLLRSFLAKTLPYPGRLNALLKISALGRFASGLDSRLDAMMRLQKVGVPAKPLLSHNRSVIPSIGETKHRVVLVVGCVQRITGNQINEAATRVLTRFGAEVIVLSQARCCGALELHMGREEAALETAWETISAIHDEIENGRVDAVIITASGCGTTIKDYAHLMQQHPHRMAAATAVVDKAVDISEFLVRLDAPGNLAVRNLPYAVAYHDACSLQHGQKVTREPRQLLEAAGFMVKDVPERHFCCGSAGTYNILQPKLANELGQRKARNIEATNAEIVAAGNLGCMTQIGLHARVPVVHTVELLDWASGGPVPPALRGREFTPVAPKQPQEEILDAAADGQTDAFW